MKTQIGIWRRICEARNSWSRAEWIANGDNVRSRHGLRISILFAAWCDSNEIESPIPVIVTFLKVYYGSKQRTYYYTILYFFLVILRYLYHMLSCTLYIIIFVFILGTHLYNNMLVTVIELRLIQMLRIIMLYS